MDVWIVDDDPEVRAATSALLRSVGFEVGTFASGEALLESQDLGEAAVILLDLRMEGLGGLETLSRLRERGSEHSVMVVTGRADVSSAVEAMRLGAADLIEKPFSPQVLIEKVQEIARRSRHRVEESETLDELRERFTALTPREAEVLQGMLKGDANKVIAYDLNISTRTVEVHRANVMRKTGFDSLAQLVRAWVVVHPDAPIED
ncbi:MAG: DNA-binding response regulator [Deltaproteobacteria bacterium]|nr:MAG: DNA-binding response regulator [Deltaproteobacteria bacterium]